MKTTVIKQKSKELAQKISGKRKITDATIPKFDLSIIIPTYNEEKYLPLLLQDLVEQETILTFEVIISDKSEDKTKEVAKEFEDRLNIRVASPNTGRGVSVQRNFGAAKAEANMYLFLDADTRLYPNSLELLKTRALDKGFYAGSAWLIPEGKRLIDHFAMSIYNIYALLRRPVSPVGPGAFLFVHKEIFDELGGFDIEVIFAEDFDLTLKIRRKGYKFAYVLAPIFRFSVRRLDEQGRLSYFSHMLWDGLFVLLPQSMQKRLIVGYKLDGHNNEKA